MKNLLLASLLLILSLCLSLVNSCADDVEDLYAHHRAFLRFTPVTAVHPLYTALQNPGMFCQITIAPKHFLFQNAQGQKASYPMTALEAYGRPECIAGFVVGTPSIPDMNMQTLPVAYDLVCPTCYESSGSIQRSLHFVAKRGEELTCDRCHCVYDLSNGGLLKEGEGCPKLYRYRLTYAGDVLVVMN